MDEKGPANKRTFTVSLNFGGENYISEGPSIKAAKQSVAAIALKQTLHHFQRKKIKKKKKGLFYLIPQNVHYVVVVFTL